MVRYTTILADNEEAVTVLTDLKQKIVESNNTILDIISRRLSCNTNVNGITTGCFRMPTRIDVCYAYFDFITLSQQFLSFSAITQLVQNANLYRLMLCLFQFQYYQLAISQFFSNNKRIHMLCRKPHNYFCHP